MAKFESFYYKSNNGRSPVREFVDKLSFKAQRKFFTKKGWLEKEGPKLPFPHARKLDEHLYELRFSAEEGIIRVVYFFYGNDIIFLTGFKKQKQKTTKQQLAGADRRRKYFLDRES